MTFLVCRMVLEDWFCTLHIGDADLLNHFEECILKIIYLYIHIGIYYFFLLK